MQNALLVVCLVCFLFLSASGFSAIPLNSRSPVSRSKNGVRSLTAVMDVFAGIALANALNNAPMNPSHLSPINFSSLNVAEKKIVQGMYKEYEVDIADTSALDQVRARGYKTAAETDEGKNKYWAIFAVLVAGSFIIPMVQYYWYVAEED